MFKNILVLLPFLAVLACEKPTPVEKTNVERAIPQIHHYLETFVAKKAGRAHADIVVCGKTGTIAERIQDCRSKPENKDWSFYSGAEIGEGDWNLVAVVGYLDKKFEVWRDERTKLLWSDMIASTYTWYRAAERSGSSSGRKLDTSANDTPSINLAAICPDAIAGSDVGQNYNLNPETAYKNTLNFSHGVVWKLPSIDDYKLANANGMRKVLPNVNAHFWTSSSYSYDRFNAWQFNGAKVVGLPIFDRDNDYSARCAAFLRN